MAPRRLVSSPLFWSATALVAIAIGLGCSSSSTSGPSGPSGGGDGGAGQDAGSATDSASDSQAQGDGAGLHDGPPPDALYGACAIKGSFGSPCSATTTGPDPTDCTDPNFPQCFVGGQGTWCTKSCTTVSDCTMGASDAGCVPTACNARGYCK